MRATIYQREQYLELADGTRYPVDGAVEIRSNTEYMSTQQQRRPRIGWKFTDSNGHVHEYVRDADGVPRLPSLERRYRMEECPGGCGDPYCEGVEVEEWFCRECVEQVEPGFTIDYNVQFPVWTDTEYTLRVVMPVTGFDAIEGARYVMIDPGAVYSFGEPEKAFDLPHLSVVEITEGFESGRIATLSASVRNAVKLKDVGP